MASCFEERYTMHDKTVAKKPHHMNKKEPAQNVSFSENIRYIHETYKRLNKLKLIDKSESVIHFILLFKCKSIVYKLCFGILCWVCKIVGFLFTTYLSIVIFFPCKNMFGNFITQMSQSTHPGTQLHVTAYLLKFSKLFNFISSSKAIKSKIEIVEYLEF